MYRGKKISVVFPAFNEEENISRAVREFLATNIVDELVVVDNNCKDDTAKLAKKYGATVVTEKRQGYGYALRKGLSVATGDYIVQAEPDGTFSAKDILQLLRPLAQYDAVLGTRTNIQYIHPQAHMHGILRWANLFLARLLQVLHGTPSLTDCGCTFRSIKKSALQTILPEFTVGSSHFLPEMVLLLTKHNASFVEIPVYYYPRVGTSKITGSFVRAVKVGWNMLTLIVQYLFI